MNDRLATAKVLKELADMRETAGKDDERKVPSASKPLSRPRNTDDREQHPAFRAWLQLEPKSNLPTRIRSLKGRRSKQAQKSYVCRLDGVGLGGESVVAKRCRPRAASVERLVYEEILPKLPSPSLRFYGIVEDPDDECAWLFLEAAKGTRYSATDSGHRRAIARWLAELQLAASSIPATSRLPDGGPQHYREDLRAGCKVIRENIGNPELEGGDVQLLDRLVSRCEAIESRWTALIEPCKQMPETIVHRDLVSKNVRVVSNGQPGLYVFDWEMAGCGVPAADLAHVDSDQPLMDVYADVIRQGWPHLNRADLYQIACVGTTFRCLAAIHWAALSLQYPWVRAGMNKLHLYDADLADTLRRMGWHV